jgi:hypothetical protein
MQSSGSVETHKQQVKAVKQTEAHTILASIEPSLGVKRVPLVGVEWVRLGRRCRRYGEALVMTAFCDIYLSLCRSFAGPNARSGNTGFIRVSCRCDQDTRPGGWTLTTTSRTAVYNRIIVASLISLDFSLLSVEFCSSSLNLQLNQAATRACVASRDHSNPYTSIHLSQYKQTTLNGVRDSKSSRASFPSNWLNQYLQ